MPLRFARITRKLKSAKRKVCFASFLGRGDFLKIKKLKFAIILIIILLIALTIFLLVTKDKTELKSIKSKKELEKIYYGKNSYDNNFEDSIFLKVIAMPFTYFEYAPRVRYSPHYYNDYYWDTDVLTFQATNSSKSTIGGINISPDIASTGTSISSSESSSSSTRDYSTTNIQVENVDEADITKTDGNYIYSLSENNVIITDVRNPEDIKIASKINVYGNAPEDLLLYNDKLIVIYSDNTSFKSSNGNTVVTIFDITDRTNPKSLKTYTLFEPYYTCRCINNNLYVISSGRLRMENNEVATDYIEDSNSKEIPLKNIQYLTTVDTNIQTIISKVDLNNIEQNISINSYLIDISNAYVSENAIYLLNYAYHGSYSYNENPPISSLFTLKGAFGPFTYEKEDEDSGYYTEIYKFDILDNGTIKYSNKAKTQGQTINQYSVDEFQGNLRVALYDNNGSKVCIYDKDMKLIGESAYVAKGEKMYSSRFIGNKVYFVTFKNMDPLFVMDLSNPKSPKVLGELKIPGYSTYLHPYDENHLIGIGMETEEQVFRNSNGRVTSTSSRITGMKMALFDVSDVTHPREISKTVIGDSRTTSAILTNPKALLFSKEKELIAIPVNNYASDFSISYSDNTQSVVSSYTNYNNNRISEGYMVYKINLKDGFNLKGVISHESNGTNNYYSNTRLLRGLYIDNNLYTVSENKVKVNNLDNLKLVSELEIIKSKTQNSETQNNRIVIDTKNIMVD